MHAFKNGPDSGERDSAVILSALNLYTAWK